MKLPMLKIAQGLSKQIIPSESVYIEGLKMFDLFDDLNNTIFGAGPLTFFVGRREVKRIEFDPENRAVPVDLEVPPNDPRMKWTKDPTSGKGVPPRAVKFVEFVIYLTQDGKPMRPIVMSIQETNKHQKKAHERLSGFIKMGDKPAPIYAKLYTVAVKSEKNDKGTFGVYVINQVDFIQDEALYKFAKSWTTSLEGKTIDVKREVDPDSFNPADIEADGSGM